MKHANISWFYDYWLKGKYDRFGEYYESFGGSKNRTKHRTKHRTKRRTKNRTKRRTKNRTKR